MVSFDVLAGGPVAVGLGSDSYSHLKAPNGLMGIKGRQQHRSDVCGHKRLGWEVRDSLSYRKL